MVPQVPSVSVVFAPTASCTRANELGVRVI
jgi:hypothetical protein